MSAAVTRQVATAASASQLQLVRAAVALALAQQAMGKRRRVSVSVSDHDFVAPIQPGARAQQKGRSTTPTASAASSPGPARSALEVARRSLAAGAECAASKKVGGRMGRGLVTTQAVPAGAAIVSERPAVHWVTAAWSNICCAHCMRISNEADLEQVHTTCCDDCGQSRWCDEVCKVADAARHDVSCGFWAWVKDKQPLDEDVAEVLSLTCSVLALRVLGDAKAEKRVHDQSADVELSPSDDKSIAEAAKLLRQYGKVAGAAKGFGSAVKVATTAWMSELVQKEKSNAFGMPMPPGASPPIRGAGLYPLLARANHSCLPNACAASSFSFATDAPTWQASQGSGGEFLQLQLRSLRPLAKSTEVFWSYTALAWPYFASVSGSGAAAGQVAAGPSAEQCPDCGKKLRQRAAIKGHVDAKAGYHCDGCVLWHSHVDLAGCSHIWLNASTGARPLTRNTDALAVITTSARRASAGSSAAASTCARSTGLIASATAVKSSASRRARPRLSLWRRMQGRLRSRPTRCCRPSCTAASGSKPSFPSSLARIPVVTGFSPQRKRRRPSATALPASTARRLCDVQRKCHCETIKKVPTSAWPRSCIQS